MKVTDYFASNEIEFIDKICAAVQKPATVDGEEVLEVFKAYKNQIRTKLEDLGLSIAELQTIKENIAIINKISVYISQIILTEKQISSQLRAEIQAQL